jgi:hypothetical protein
VCCVFVGRCGVVWLWCGCGVVVVWLWCGVVWCGEVRRLCGVLCFFFFFFRCDVFAFLLRARVWILLHLDDSEYILRVMDQVLCSNLSLLSFVFLSFLVYLLLACLLSLSCRVLWFCHVLSGLFYSCLSIVLSCELSYLCLVLNALVWV